MRALGCRLDSLPRIARGEGSYRYDTTGRRYLDGSGGPAAFSIGHGQFVADRLVIMERPAPDLQTVDYAASRERPWGRRTLMAGLMLAAFAARALMPPGFVPASGLPRM